jgi:hypothetical protein
VSGAMMLRGPEWGLRRNCRSQGEMEGRSLASSRFHTGTKWAGGRSAGALPGFTGHDFATRPSVYPGLSRNDLR